MMIDTKKRIMWTLKQVVEAPPHDPHKYQALFLDPDTKKQKRTLFGRRGYSDYTLHKDKDRRESYRLRHRKDLRTNDPTRAGYLSYYLLWGPSTSLAQNIRYFKKEILPHTRPPS